MLKVPKSCVLVNLFTKDKTIISTISTSSNNIILYYHLITYIDYVEEYYLYFLLHTNK